MKIQKISSLLLATGVTNPAVFWLFTVSIVNGLFDVVGISVLIPLFFGSEKFNFSLFGFDFNNLSTKMLVVFVGVFFVVRQAIMVSSHFLVHHFAYKAYRILSLKIIQNVVFSQTFFRGDIKQSEMVKALVNDAVMVTNAGFKNLLGILADFIVSFILVIFVFAFYGIEAAVFVSGIFIVSVIPILLIQRRLKSLADERQVHDFARQEDLITVLSGALPIAVQRKKDLVLQRIKINLSKYTRLEVLFGVLVSAPRIFIEFLFLFLVCSAALTVANDLNLPDFLANGLVLIVLLSRFAPIFQRMMLAAMQIRTAGPAIDHIFSLVQTKKETNPEENLGAAVFSEVSSPQTISVKVPNKTQNIVFDRAGLNFIIGKSGVGKTTFLAKLIGVMPTSRDSEVIVSSNNTECKGSFLRAGLKIGFVAQNGNIVSGTIRENFQLANPDLSDIEIWTCLREFGLQDRFGCNEHGLDTYIADNGKQLSGGERQRLNLSLACSGEIDVLLLDEPFSGLDISNKEKFLGIVRSLSKDVIIIIVTHDENSIQPNDSCLDFNLDGHLLQDF